MAPVSRTVALLVAGAVLAFLRTLFTRQRRIWKAKQNGCESPSRYPHKDPVLGLDLFFADFAAMKAGNGSTQRRERFARYGKTYVANSWGTRFVHTMEKDNIRAVLADSFSSFGVQPNRLSIGEPFIGPGVFSTDGPYWEHSRALIRPMFKRARISDFAQLDVHLDRMLARLPRDGRTIDLQPLLKLMLLDHSTEMIFGQSTAALLNPEVDEEANELLQTYSQALKRLGMRILLGRMRVLSFWDRSYARLARAVHVIVDKYIDAAIERRKEQQALETPTQSNTRFVIADELVAATDDRTEIRNQLINIFLPARDAIAIGLGGVLFHLARNPQAWDTLRSEVLKLDPNEPLTYDVLQSMTYMKAVLNESLRLLAPAGRNIRICLRDTILPTVGGPEGKAPIYMFRGDQIGVNFDAMQRDPLLWGEDADMFRPERWLKNDTEGTTADGKSGQSKIMNPGWSYIPFSGGPRVCPGKQITLTDTAYILVRLMRIFERMENRDPEPIFVEESRLTVDSRNGVLVGLIPAVEGL